MLFILTHTQLVLLSISNVQGVVLCLPRFWASQSAVLTTVPSHMSVLALWGRMIVPLSNWGCEGTVIWGMFPRGVRIPSSAAAYYAMGGGMQWV